MANKLADKESEDRRGKTPVTQITTKEDGENERQRRQSADEEDADEEAMTQGRPYLIEAGDVYDSKGGANTVDRGDNQRRRQY